MDVQPKNNKNLYVKVGEDDFGLILNCAVRYAIGRKTYVPMSVVEYIVPLLTELNDTTIDCFISDLEEEQSMIENGIGSWGFYEDEKMWLNFLELCRNEKSRRKSDNGTNE